MPYRLLKRQYVCGYQRMSDFPVVWFVFYAVVRDFWDGRVEMIIIR